VVKSFCKDFFFSTWVCFDWKVWSFACFNKLFWVDVVGMLGIIKTPPTKVPLIVSGNKCWFGCVPVIFSAAPIESCPMVFSVYFDEFYCAMLLVGFVDVVPSALVE